MLFFSSHRMALTYSIAMLGASILVRPVVWSFIPIKPFHLCCRDPVKCSCERVTLESDDYDDDGEDGRQSSGMSPRHHRHHRSPIVLFINALIWGAPNRAAFPVLNLYIPTRWMCVLVGTKQMSVFFFVYSTWMLFNGRRVVRSKSSKWSLGNLIDSFVS